MLHERHDTGTGHICGIARITSDDARRAVYTCKPLLLPRDLHKKRLFIARGRKMISYGIHETSDKYGRKDQPATR